MKLPAFSILTALALIYAGLTLAETAMYQVWEKKSEDQKNIQAQVVFFQNMDSAIRQLLQRMYLDSQRDPALAELLKANKVKVVVSSPDSPGPEAIPATPASSGSPAQLTPDQTPHPAH